MALSPSKQATKAQEMSDMLIYLFISSNQRSLLAEAGTKPHSLVELLSTVGAFGVQWLEEMCRSCKATSTAAIRLSISARGRKRAWTTLDICMN